MITALAGLGGLGFVLTAVVLNVCYIRIGLPQPTTSLPLNAISDSLAAVGGRLKRPSIIAPATWLFTTLFAGGVLSAVWDSSAQTTAWALVGFAGVLMQNATFMVVEALRFGAVSAAAQSRESVTGLWALSSVLFGFNQVFLAIALLGFTAAGSSIGLVPAWHAWLGYLSAALLFLSSMAGPYNVDGTNRVAVIGLIGWFGWAAWIVAYSITLLSI